jgi:predicted permease
MSGWIQDLRSAARWMRRSPWLAAIAVISLGVGIGVNTTVFSIVYGVLMRPFELDRPEELVLVEDARPQSFQWYGASYPNFLEWRARATSYSSVAAFVHRNLAISEGGEPQRYLGAAVSANLFPTLGVAPGLGRTFGPGDDRVGAPATVLLSHELWERRYSSDPAIVGRVVTVNATPHTVIGVMPERFQYPMNQKLWVPLAPVANAWPRTARSLQIVARLNPGVDLDRATSEATAIAAQLAKTWPNENRGWTARVRTLAEDFRPPQVRLMLLVQLAAVMFVLLIACANVANLMLARAVGRQREIAIRAAMGAGRPRIVRQLLTESALLGLGGGVIGVLIAAWGTELLAKAIPPGSLPYFIRIAVDGPVLLYTLAISLLTAILFGLTPALELAKVDLHGSLKDGVRSTDGVRRTRFRNTLVVGQVALALVLLVGSALFIRSFVRLLGERAGFDTEKLMTLRIELPDERYPTPRARTRLVEDMIHRVEGIPGVEAAAASDAIALEHGGNVDGLIVEGHEPPAGEETQVFYTGVTAHWFATHGLRPVRGRVFTPAEAGESSGVAIVNEKLARHYWPGADPIGRRLRFVSDTTRHWLEVVGIVSDFRLTDFDKDPVAAVFVPHLYLSSPNPGLTVRVRRDPAAVSDLVRREIRAADPNLPVFDLRTMEEVRRRSFWEKMLFGKIFGMFGAIALLLASVGLYGVIAYGVSQRTHEIGVRIALGARSGDVIRLVLGQGMRLAVVGIVIGLAGAFGVTRVIQSQLWGVSATDPVSFAGIATLLAAIAALASWLPARRATRVDPITALRDE